MEVCTEQYFTQKQIDSLTNSDTLPNLGMWMDLSLQEFETKEKIRKNIDFPKRSCIMNMFVKQQIKENVS